MNQKVLLLVDNAESHFNSKRFENNNEEEEEISESDNNQNSKKQKKKTKPNIKLTNIELAYLLPNTTAHL